MDQLIEVIHSWTEDIDKVLAVDVIYLDFIKALDKVPHRKHLTEGNNETR